MLINTWSHRALVKPKKLQEAVKFRCIDSLSKKEKISPETR